MYNLEDVNERTTPTIVLTFTDEDGDPVVPDSVTYRIDDVSSGTAILAATTLGLGEMGETIEILLTTTQTRILDDDHKFENRRVTVDFTYSTNRHGTNQYLFRVVNLPGIPIS